MTPVRSGPSSLCDLCYVTMNDFSWELLIHCYETNVTEQWQCQPEWEQMEIQWRKPQPVTLSQHNHDSQISLLCKDCMRSMWWGRVALLSWSRPCTYQPNCKTGKMYTPWVKTSTWPSYRMTQKCNFPKHRKRKPATSKVTSCPPRSQQAVKSWSSALIRWSGTLVSNSDLSAVAHSRADYLSSTVSCAEENRNLLAV